MPSLFWFETLAVVAFSVSWLVKGQAFPVLNDKQPVSGSHDRDEFIISYATMRRLVGWLALSLPFILPAGYVIFFSRHGFPGSISSYYYTGMRNYLVGALCVLGVLFVAYDAYHDILDSWITNLAGIFVVSIAFFPTEPTAAPPHEKDIGHIHYVFAALLFTMLAVMALRFTKTHPDGYPASQKSRRSLIYITCAALITASMLVAFGHDRSADGR
jgi:hypothetical protein